MKAMPSRSQCSSAASQPPSARLKRFCTDTIGTCCCASTSSPKSLQWTLDVVTAGPALVTNGRQDLLAANRLGRAFFADLYDSDTQPPHMARFQFLAPAARRFYPDWDLIADMTVDASAATTPASNASTTRSLTLAWHGSAVDGEPGLTLLIHTAEFGSPSEEALRLLSSWTASQNGASSTDRLGRHRCPGLPVRTGYCGPGRRTGRGRLTATAGRRPI
ncbi:hypothetical protein [Streptomyces sp. NPDC051001]|uniref:MmyB family transcriptional regulator n=1 Tax=Streptomyces sp. NPDC051001 TaxID=3155795 RepID=UPI003412FA0D